MHGFEQLSPLCPFFDPGAVTAAIDGLPDTLAADDSTWSLVYDFEGKPAWIWPHGQIPPSNLSTSADGSHGGFGVRYQLALSSAATNDAAAGELLAAQRCPERAASGVRPEVICPTMAFIAASMSLKLSTG